MSFIKRAFNKIGVDVHVLSAVLARGWSAVAGLVMMLGIPHWLSPSAQGVYFTFYSLLALQVFFELGFCYVIVQVVSHEAANIRLGNNIAIDGSQYSRMASIVRMIPKLYGVISVVFFIVVCVSGIVFFERANIQDVSGWKIGWFFLVLCSAANLFLSPFLAVAEGSGRVGQVARLRMIQSIVGYLSLWAMFTAGVGLAAVPIVAFVATVGTSIWLMTSGRFIIRLARCSIPEHAEKVNWKKEIFPFQWKIAVSWMSSYLMFQLFNPILLTYRGAVEAGRVGLALTVFNTLFGIAISWVTAKAPVIGGAIARGDKKTAKSICRNLAIYANLFYFFCAIVILSIFFLAKKFGFNFGSRLPDMSILICIAIMWQINLFTGVIGVYLRAHKTEPLLLSSLVTSIICGISILIGAQFSALVAVIFCCAVILFVGLPWMIWVARRFEITAVVPVAVNIS